MRRTRQPGTAGRPAGRRRCRAMAVGAAAALACGLLSACGAFGASGGSSQGGVTLQLDNGQHEQTTDGLVTAFERATGINVEVTNDDEDIFANEIANAGGHSPADLIYTENSPALEFLQSKGLLAKVDPGTLAHVPAKYSSPQGDWVGVSARVSVLIYNPSLISASQLPTSVMQLADPKYRGKLAFAAGETDFQPVVTSVDRVYGQAATLKWLDGIKANAAGHLVPDNETIADEVNRGIVAFGVVNQYYWYRMATEIGQAGMHSKIAYFAPHDPGYVIDVSGAAVLKSSKHQAAAQKFLAFLVSRQGQEIIAHSGPAEESFEYPLGDGVTTAAHETPLGKLQPYPITIGELGTGQTAIKLLQDAGLS